MYRVNWKKNDEKNKKKTFVNIGLKINNITQKNYIMWTMEVYSLNNSVKKN